MLSVCIHLFLLKVDTTIPVVHNCPSNITSIIEIGQSSQVVSWTEPYATDPAGLRSSNPVTQSHNPGQQFQVGTTMISYTFYDSSGNEATCTFAVVVTEGNTNNNNNKNNITEV